MTRIIAIVAGVMAAVAAAALFAGSLLLWIRVHPSAPVPSPVYLAFDSWGYGWILPPLATAEYELKVVYQREEGFRLGEDEPLKIKLLDETVGKIVPIENNPPFPETPAFREIETIVGKCNLSEGHQYRIDVDPDQVKELGLHHHRLRISLSPDEYLERTFGEPKAAKRPRAPRKWDPAKLETKARAIRTAREAAGRP